MSLHFGKIHIEISNACNLQCSFCPEVQRPKQIMNSENFRTILAKVKPFTEQIALHLMGEPLMHPQFEEILNICEELKVPVHLVTNGVLLKTKSPDLLLHPSLRQVNFSLHSFTNNFPNKDPETYLNKIFEYTKKAFELRPNIYINYRLWDLKAPQGQAPTNSHLLNRVLKEFSFDLPSQLDMEKKKSFRVQNRLYLSFDTEFIWPSLDLAIRNQKGSCYGLRSHVGILVDGTLVPCCLDKEGIIPLGNVFTENFESIIQSERAQKMLNGFLNHQLIEDLCQRCQFIERFS